jgi:DNA-binding transcriptional regulator YiaG
LNENLEQKKGKNSLSHDEFKNLLKNNNFTQKTFSKKVRISYGVIKNWSLNKNNRKKGSVPLWVNSWFENYQYELKLEKIKNMILSLEKESNPLIEIDKKLDKSEFKKVLKELEINQIVLASQLHLTPQAISNWGDVNTNFPRWLNSWLLNFQKKELCKKNEDLLIEMLQIINPEYIKASQTIFYERGVGISTYIEHQLKYSNKKDKKKLLNEIKDLRDFYDNLLKEYS